MKYRVGVVIPHYRSARDLGRALESVFSQTFNPTDVVVVDDASGAESMEALHRVLAVFPSARLIELRENAGPAYARNVGWVSLSTEFVAFLDADDAWEPTKLEQQMTVFRKWPDTTCVTTQLRVQDSMVEWAPTAAAGDAVNARVSRIAFAEFLLHNPIATSTVVLRRWMDVGFPEDQRLAEDYALWLKVARIGPCRRVEAKLAVAFKRTFGEGGLSAELWPMVRGEVKTLRRAVAERDVSFGQGILAFMVLAMRVALRYIRAVAFWLRRSFRD